MGWITHSPCGVNALWSGPVGFPLPALDLTKEREMKGKLTAVLVFAGPTLILAACATPTAAPAPTQPPPQATALPEPTQPAFTAPEGALVSVPVQSAPVLDGLADD